MQLYGPMILRLALGAVFVAHGLPKLLPIWGQDPAHAAALFASLGLQPAPLFAGIVGGAEVLGGVALVAGAFSFWVSLILIVDMAVAVWGAHYASGFFINWALTPGVGNGYEFHLVLIAALASLMLTGPGAFSIDHRRHRELEAEAMGRARLRSTEPTAH